MRASPRACTLALTVFVLLTPGLPVGNAATWQLTDIVDTTDLMPDGASFYFDLSQAVIEGDTIVFHGYNEVYGGYGGIFTYDGSTVDVVADTTTLVPGRADTFFSFGSPSVSGNNIAFSGTFGPLHARKEGLYTSIGGTLSTVVDTETPIPDGTGNFTRLARASLHGTDAGFRGMGSDQDGIYTSIGGSLAMVADTDTILPGGTGDLDWVWYPSFNGSHVAFRATDYAGPGWTNGIYTNLGGTLHVVADEGTLMPGSGIPFYNLGWDVSLEGDRVAFTGTTSPLMGDPTGLFIYDDSEGGYTVIANQDTPIPGGTGNFTGFGIPSLSGENVAFFGTGYDLQRGIYAFVDGELSEVVSTNMLLDDFSGYTSLDVRFTTEGLSGTSLVFDVMFLDESDPYAPEVVGRALYRADLVTSTVPEPASMFLVCAGLVSLAGMRRRVTR